MPSCSQAPWSSSYLLLRGFQRQKNGRWGEALPETEGGGLVGAAVGVRLASVSMGGRERQSSVLCSGSGVVLAEVPVDEEPEDAGMLSC